ncbi:RidA family protein [Nonomuraea deserti]|uniref:RidA family protein n=1 Tax=Nonomuraea deserti TaxID=1848322 RepID=A0A4R4VHU6_9ACTN|nr:RidA family protein [Nonomuraea deserti]TDD05228.1 RidA family protein [Nonomuraea deserti]
MVRRWSPPEVGAPLAKYHHLAAAPADSELLFIAGQVGTDATGALVGDDAAAQARQIFANIETLLASAGSGPEHLLRLFTMVAGTEHLAGFRSTLDEVFAAWFPGGDWPANSLIVAAALAAPEIVVEVEAVAVVPARPAG